MIDSILGASDAVELLSVRCCCCCDCDETRPYKHKQGGVDGSAFWKSEGL